jgi:hypothetical protein
LQSLFCCNTVLLLFPQCPCAPALVPLQLIHRSPASPLPPRRCNTIEIQSIDIAPLQSLSCGPCPSAVASRFCCCCPSAPAPVAPAPLPHCYCSCPSAPAPVPLQVIDRSSPLPRSPLLLQLPL